MKLGLGRKRNIKKGSVSSETIPQLAKCRRLVVKIVFFNLAEGNSKKSLLHLSPLYNLIVLCKHQITY